MTSRPGRRLHMRAVFGEAAEVLRARRKSFADATLVPLLALTLWATLVASLEPIFAPVAPLHLLLFTYLAIPVMVATFRLTLQDSGAERRTVLPRWSARELRVLGWMLVLGAGCAALRMLSGIAFASLVRSRHVTQQLFTRGVGALWWTLPILFVIALAAFYIASRLSILFPAAAIEAGKSPLWAWKTTRGYGPELCAIWLALVFLGVTPRLVFLVPSSPETIWVQQLVVSAISASWIVVQSVVAALVYRELAGEPRGAPEEVAFLQEYGLV